MAGKYKNEEFLRNFGGLEVNDITNIINCESEIGDNTATVIKVSNYHDMEDILNSKTLQSKTQFKILGFNTESISSKIDNIRIFLEALKLKDIFFDAICLNECWLEYFGEDLNLLGYTPFILTRKVGLKGGLVTYVQENYKIKE